MQAEALLDHAAFVRSLAESLTFGGEDPDDLVQQTWLAAIEHSPTPGPGIKGWLATVLRNALRQHRRSEGRRAVREAVVHAPAAMPTPDEIRDREAVRREVVEAVLDLDEPYRTAVLLRYYEDLPPREIAARTGDPVETVKTRLVRARAKLRGRLDERHGADGRQWGFAVAGLALWPGEGRAAATAASGVPVLALVAGIVAAVIVAAVGINFLTASPGDTAPERILASVEGDGDGPVKPAAPAGEKGKAKNAPASSSEDRPGVAGTGASIVGRVLDHATHVPLPGAAVRLVLSTRPPRTTDVVADAEGKFRFDEVTCGVEVRIFVLNRGRPDLFGITAPARVLKAGEVANWDLTARRQEGINLRIHLRLPEGTKPPETLRMISAFESPGMNIHDVTDLEVDPETLVLSVFLKVGRHRLAFESPRLEGALPEWRVTGDGPPEDVVLELVERSGIHLRLVDGKGHPLARGPVRVLVTMKHSSTDSAGNTNYSLDSLDYHETDERGELDLTPILPALNDASRFVTAFGFCLEAEGVFPGTMLTPNFEISVEELKARQERMPGGAVVLEVPALPYKSMIAWVRNTEREPVADVHVIGLPADHFAGGEVVSDADGRIEIRILKAEPMMPTGPEERPRLVARPPWAGQVALRSLGREEFPGGPQSALVVQPAAEISLRFVDDLGQPVAWSEVTIDGANAKTDAAGVVRVAVAGGTRSIEVVAANHFPTRVTPAGVGQETTVALVRSRELWVLCLKPDGTKTMPALFGRVDGEDRVYQIRGYNREERTQRMLLPRKTVKIQAYRNRNVLVGEAIVGPDETELEIRLSGK